MRIEGEVKKKILKYLKAEHFKEDTLVRMIADKDVNLAFDIMCYYGGLKEYIPTPVHTCNYALRKYTRTERDKCKSRKHIAMDLGMSLDQIDRLSTSSNDLTDALPDIPE